MIESASAAIVVTAQTFNPSIFTERWLDQNKIVETADFIGVRVFSPDLAQFQTPYLQVLILPPKMQVIFDLNQQGTAEKPRALVGKVVKLLPHTPYQALGLNFDYFVGAATGLEFGDFNRRLFGCGPDPLSTEFGAPDARFGRYFSKQFGEARLKLNVVPVHVPPDNRERMQLSFNFHHDLAAQDQPERVEKLIRSLEAWERLKVCATELAAKVESVR